MTARYQGPPIDQLVNGEVYDLHTHYMTGKLYNQETREYTRDNRVMAWVVKSFTEVLYYKVFESDEAIREHFEVI